MSRFVRAQIELLDNNFHSVMYIREVSRICMELGYKPVEAMGICDQHGVRRFYVDILLRPDQMLCEEELERHQGKIRIQAVDPSLNLTRNSANSMHETYYDETQPKDKQIIYSPFSFSGNQPSTDCIYNVCRDAYSDTVSYSKL